MSLKPARLNLGDTLGVIAPASAPGNPDTIDLGLAALEKLGFKTRPAPNLRKRSGFLAGTDRERADDLMRMFLDPDIHGILCLRGGYGTARLLPLLDYQAIRANPKVFVGYSDITSLHCAFLAKAGLVSFHGPMVTSDFSKPTVSEFASQSLLRIVMQPQPAGSIRAGSRIKTTKVLAGGKAVGTLVGGNLSILCAALGTPFQPSFKGAVLFIEDVNEEPYRFDRMLTQLLNAGLLQQVSGVAIGVNKRCRDPKARTAKEYRQSLEDVFRERLLPLRIPIVMGLPFGHIRHNATLPQGAQVLLDADEGDLSILEAAVR
jgi:muramoyltetrapeptide carboxypeptidase